MKKYCIILLLLAPFCLKAQSNYKKGLIVNLKGDTLHGYIDYKEWGQNPESINFKRLFSEKEKRFGIFDISYFEITGFERYQKYNVKISLSEVEVSKVSINPDTTSKTESVFFKILQQGKVVTLYSYNDNIKNRFYIKDNTMDTPEELTYRVYLDSTNSSNLIAKNIYRNQLNQLSFKYNLGSVKLTRQIEQISYNENDLLSITSKINGYNEKQIRSESARTFKSRFFLGGAFNISNLKYEGNNLANSNGSTSSLPKITMGLDIFDNPNIGKLIFRGELSFGLSNYNIKAGDQTFTGYLETSTQKIKQLTASLSPQIIYNFYNTYLIKIFFGTGLSLNVSSYPTNEYSITISNNTSSKSDYPELKNVWFSIPLKAGVVLHKKLEIYGSYFPGSSVTNYDQFSGKVSSYQIGINYLL